MVCAMVLQYSSVLVSLQIKQVRRATREEKKRKAMAMREKELGALGLQVSCGPPIYTHIHTCTHSRTIVYACVTVRFSSVAPKHCYSIILHTRFVASFPGLPHLYLPFAFRIIHRSGRAAKRGRPGSIGGHICENNALYHPFQCFTAVQA